MSSKREEFMQAFTIALIKADLDTLVGGVTEDIHWNIPGKQSIDGKSELAKAIESMDSATDFTIENIISHGQDVAANGIMTVKGKSIAFCHVYRSRGFKNGQIKDITSYIIELV